MEDSSEAKMDENENAATLSGSTTVVTTDPSVTWAALGNGQLKQTKNGHNSQLGALLASGAQNSQNTAIKNSSYHARTRLPTSNLSNWLILRQVKYHKELLNHKTIDIKLHNSLTRGTTTSLPQFSYK